MKVMLLAAGKGERMLPLTAHTPKPLLKAGGLSLLEHQIRKLAQHGFTDLVINHAWLGQQIESEFGDGSRWGVSISWSREGEPLETAGGIIRALPLLGSQPFAVVNADLWTRYNYSQLRTGLAVGDLAHLVLVPNPKHHLAGDFLLNQNSRLGLPESTQSTLVSTFTYSGIAVYHPDFFGGVSTEKYPLLPLIKTAIIQQQASGILFTGEWLDVGTPARLHELEQRLQQQIQQ